MKNTVAYHEAGHAVVEFFLFGKVKKVSIIPGKEFQGQTTSYSVKNLDPDIDFSPRTKDNLEKIIVIFYAGNEATKRFKGRYDYIGSQSDYKKIGNISIYLTTGGKAEGYFLKYLRERAKDLVKHHWSSVVALAEQLMVKKTMETKEIEDAIRCSWKGGKQNDT